MEDLKAFPFFPPFPAFYIGGGKFRERESRFREVSGRVGKWEINSNGRESIFSPIPALTSNCGG